MSLLPLKFIPLLRTELRGVWDSWSINISPLTG